MKKITPFLWFDDKAEEAVHFYITILDASKNNNPARHAKAGSDFPVPDRSGKKPLTFDLHGQEFVALIGGPTFTFSPPLSFAVTCASQEEVDALWEKLAAGNDEKYAAMLQATAQMRADGQDRARVPGGSAAEKRPTVR